MNSKKNDRLQEDAFNDCLESILIGNESIESCLSRYPKYSKELKPLLETLEAAGSARDITPDPVFRARARYEFRRALYDKASLKSQPSFVWRWRWATIASTIGVLILTTTGGVMAASSSSMPGQPLYQIKRAIEDVQLALTPSQAAKTRLYATLADHRVSEILYAAQLGDVQLTENLTQQFANDLSMVSAIAAPARALTFGGSSKQSGAPSTGGSTPEQSTTTSNSVGSTNDTTTQLPTTTTAPLMSSSVPIVAPPITVEQIPQPTIIVSQPPAVTITQAAPAPAPTSPQPQTSLSGITDPALLKLLQLYSVKNISELLSILDRIPPSTRTALLAAIQAATSGYGQILGS